MNKEKEELILQGFARCPEHIQNAILILGASNGDLRWEAVEYAAKTQQIEKTITKIKEICARCKGRGWFLRNFSDNHRTICPDCNGRGEQQL